MAELDQKIKNLEENEKKKKDNKVKTEDYKEDEDNGENLTGRIYLLEKKIEDKKYIYQYKYHRKCGNNIDLRCRDYKCKDTA